MKREKEDSEHSKQKELLGMISGRRGAQGDKLKPLCVWTRTSAAPNLVQAAIPCLAPHCYSLVSARLS